MIEAVRKAAYNVEVYERAVIDLQVRLGELGDRDTVVLQLFGGQTMTITAHSLVELYNAERDRLVKYSTACRNAGVEERRIEITEELGRQLVDVIKGTVAALFATLVVEAEGRQLTPARLREIEADEVPALVAVEVARVRRAAPPPSGATASESRRTPPC